VARTELLDQRARFHVLELGLASTQCLTSVSAARSSLVWDVTYRTLVVTDVLGPNMGSHLQGTLEGGTDRLSRNVVNYQSALRSITHERKPKIVKSLRHVGTSLVVMAVRHGLFHGLYQTDDADVRLGS
jgi:hypothetical protein